MTVHAHEAEHSKSALTLAIAATAAILVVELAGGLWTNSLALLSDAAHVFMDLLSFVLTLFAIRLAEKPTSDVRTYGWHRMEVLAAVINGLTVFFIAFFIFAQAIRRLSVPEIVLVPQMLAIAGLGLVVNLFVIWKLHPHAGKDVNVRGAFLHAFGDAAASLAVVGGGLLILETGKTVVDPIVAMAVAVIILFGAFRLLGDSVHILLEGTPKGLDRRLVVREIESVAGAGSVRDLHVWNLCSHLCALSVHLVAREGDLPRQREVLEQIRGNLRDKFNIVHSTIQIEFEHWKSDPSKGGAQHG